MENITPRVVFLQHEFSNRTAKPKHPNSRRWLNALPGLVPVRLPALRERREDVPLLAAHFLQRQRAGGHTTALCLGGAALERLANHDWPGNVRELRNAVEYGALQAATVESAEVLAEHLPAAMMMVGRQNAKSGAMSGAKGWDYRFHLARTELELADRAIRERGIQQKTALGRALGYTDRYTLLRRINKALVDFPGLGAEFTAVAKLFREGGGK